MSKLKGTIRKQKSVSNYWVESQGKKYSLHFVTLQNIDPGKLAYEYEGETCEFSLDENIAMQGYDGCIKHGSLKIIQ